MLFRSLLYVSLSSHLFFYNILSLISLLSLFDGGVKEDIGHHSDGFHFPSFLLHGFHFFVVLVVGSSNFLRSRIYLGLSLHFDNLEQILKCS